MLKKLKKFTQLESTQRWLFVEAYARLGMMRAAILSLPFKRMVSSLEHRQDEVSPRLNSAQMEMALAIGEAVRTAAGNTPWESACLAQTLTAQRMLSNRGIGGMFHLGATMDDTSEEKLKAHAWLLCGKEIITGEAGHEQYAVLSTFSWKGE
ncbi:MAG: lasso peptide biosynthesis B2 protein [Pseudomonadota bacterium]|nr:lasso peptide biosynthesis B2 protein [Pseudomonadota bacterium]